MLTSCPHKNLQLHQLSACFFIWISLPPLDSLCICTHHNLFSKFNLKSLMRNFINITTTHFQLGWNFFLQNLSLHNSETDEPENGKELGDIKKWQESGEAVECAVCLCKIEEGDEIRELRCDHFFHRVCLDRWVGYRRVNCPLCRGSLASRRTADELTGEVKVLLIKFCSFRSDDRTSWWLR